MTYDIGDIAVLTLEVRDSSGALSAGGAVSGSWTLPTGTVQAAIVTNPSTGLYAATLPVTLAGAHVLRWTVTGANAGAAVDMFATSAAAPPILSLAEAKRHLRLAATDISRDDDLRDVIETATVLCEDHTGRRYRPIVVTETYDGGREAIALRCSPVQSVTSVTVDGEAVTEYVLSAPGLLYLGTPTAPRCWPAGIATVAVTYVAGSPSPSPRVVEAVRVATAHLWAARRGGSNLPRQSGGDVDYASGAEPWALPRRAEQLLVHDMAPGF